MRELAKRLIAEEARRSKAQEARSNVHLRVVDTSASKLVGAPRDRHGDVALEGERNRGSRGERRAAAR